MNTHDPKNDSRNPEIPGAEGQIPQKKRTPFYRSVLPWKGDGRRVVFYKLLSLVAGLVFLLCAAYLVNDLLIQPAIADREQQDLMKVYYADSTPSSASPQESAAPVSSAPPERDAQGRLIRFVELQKVNPDIVGWIRVPNTNIDLPVLQGHENDPEFYLDHDYNKKPSKFGSVFADYRGPVAGDKSMSMILYGHTLNSGRMFSELEKYKNLDFLRQNPVFTFDSANSPAQWKIISVFLTNTLPEQGTPFDYMKTRFKNDSDFLNFVYQLRIRSLFNTGVGFRADDRIVLLSTCSYEFTDFREVVVARRVRDGESPTVDPAQISYNGKTLYPDSWYKKNGGEKPVWPATYKEAVQKNVLPWRESE